ncbi:MAG: hypothetical protein ACRC50_05380, partial [Gaiella sp.]
STETMSTEEEVMETTAETTRAPGMPDEATTTTPPSAQARPTSLGAQAKSELRAQVEARKGQLGEQTRALASALRSSGEQLELEGRGAVAGLATGAAERLERGTEYLQELDAQRLLDDAERMARRMPWLTAGAAALVGFAGSRFVKASSERRYERSRAESPPPGERWPGEQHVERRYSAEPVAGRAG